MKNCIPILCISILLSCAACDGDGGGLPNIVKSPFPGVSNPVPLSGDAIACVDGDDCAIVELGCCDHCNGGFAVAVNREFETEVAERNGESCGEDDVCTEMGCASLVPRCIDGECSYADEASPDWQACSGDSDCVVVELGCCDHCNGGRVMAVNMEYEQQVKENMADVCDENTVCTLMACAPEIVKCDSGTCVSYPDPEWGPY